MRRPRYRHATRGEHPIYDGETGLPHESELESDFISLALFVAKPPKIIRPAPLGYRRPNGRNSHYTPDFLLLPEPPVQGILAEIKWRDDLRENWSEYRPKFVAARAHARERDLLYRVYTESGIRTPRLQTALMVLPHRGDRFDEDAAARLLTALEWRGAVSLGDLLDGACRGAEDRLVCLNALWCLMAHFRISVLDDGPVTPRTRVALP